MISDDFTWFQVVSGDFNFYNIRLGLLNYFWNVITLCKKVKFLC